ncbi:MAG: LysE family translocator, partial [Candidatus Binatia bacterium]
GFLMGFVGSMPISGPISLLVFHRGMLARFQDGWAIGLGGAIAEGIYVAVAIQGLSLLRERFPFLEPLVKGMGILVLFGIGLYFLFARQKDHEGNPSANRSESNWVGQFAVGFTVAALNPTLILTWSTAAAMIYSIANLTLGTYEWIVFVCSVVFGIAAWFSVLLALLQRFREHFPLSKLQRVIRSVGVILIASSAAWAAWILIG